MNEELFDSRLNALEISNAKLNAIVERLDKAVDGLTNINAVFATLAERLDNQKDTNKDNIDRIEEDLEKIELRVRKTEKYMWILTGAAAILGSVITIASDYLFYYFTTYFAKHH